MRLFPSLLTLLATALPAEEMSWLENDQIRLGIDLSRGGSITFLAKVSDGANVINNHDLGRQVQLSFFSGPVPFSVEGQEPTEHWRHIGWNPIQSGDDFDNSARILEHHNDGKRIHVACVPMQWPLNKVPGDCRFDSWLELEGPVVKARARLTNARVDRTLYPARLQELPAVYANAAFHRVVSYQGARPFTGDAAGLAPVPDGKHPWSFWMATEGWAALLDEKDQGLGLVTPGRVHFTGGFAGQPGPNDTLGNSTGYLAGQGQEILDHDIVYEFRYELVLGSLEEIRSQAARHRPAGPPAWTFSADRQSWHYQNLRDAGWPIAGQLEFAFEQDDPQLISPVFFCEAEEAPVLVIDAAFSTMQKQGVVMWQALDEESFSGGHFATFPITGDGRFRSHVIRLADHPDYRGGIVRLRIDPVGQAEAGASMKLRGVRLTSAGPE